MLNIDLKSFTIKLIVKIDMFNIILSKFLIINFFLSFIILNSGVSQTLEEVVNSDDRTPIYRKRDNYRNPLETLSFFKISNDMTVIELQPSGGNSPGGWYTEILAPFLKNQGTLIAAHFNPKESEWRKKMRTIFEKRISEEKNFSKIKLSVLSMPPQMLTENNSADMVLTFRNLHNWLKSGYLEQVFQVSFDALKPGGIFGVVEHRAPQNFTVKQMVKSGYVTEDLAIYYAEKVGFRLQAKSEINANKKDTKNHKNGVWNLPPTLKINKEQNREKFLKIGESDRMTLKFIKP